MNISLFDHFLAQDSNVKSLAKEIPSAQIEEMIEKAARSVTSVNLDCWMVYDHVTATWGEESIPSQELMTSPETFAASVSIFKSIFYEGANSFKFFPEVFLDWYKCISSALQDDNYIDGVLMLTHQAAAIANDYRNESSSFQSMQFDYDLEVDQVRKSPLPLTTQERIVSNNVTAEKKSAERAPVPPLPETQTMNDVVAEKPHTEQQEIPFIVISPPLPQPATDPQAHFILSNPIN